MHRRHLSDTLRLRMTRRHVPPISPQDKMLRWVLENKARAIVGAIEVNRATA